MSQQDQQGTSDRLRLLHWNIHSWRSEDGASNVDAVGNLIAETRPHVVSLVEVNEPWGMPDALAAVAKRLGYAWMFVPSFEFGDEAPRGGFGNALLTKLPVLAAQHCQLLWPTRVYDGSEPSEQRSVLLARIDVSGKPVWVGSTHLPRRNADARRDALDRLMVLTGKLDAPWVICGDFNVPASAWVEGSGSVVVSPNPAMPTYPAGQATEAIDYVIASPGSTTEAEVLTAAGSDHWAVLASVTV